MYHGTCCQKGGVTAHVNYFTKETYGEGEHQTFGDSLELPALCFQVPTASAVRIVISGMWKKEKTFLNCQRVQ